MIYGRVGVPDYSCLVRLRARGLQTKGETCLWLPERRYLLLNGGVNRAWDLGGGRGQPEAVGALSRVLALDPEFETLVAHGYTDLVTPYYASELVRRQLSLCRLPTH